MKAVVVQRDGELTWQEVPDPVPAAGEVLLRIRATAVNRADLLQRRGLYPPPPGAPEWMGLEASGVIEKAEAGADSWRPGSAACCLLAGGGYAEKVAVPGALLLPIPRGLSLEEAAALPEAFATAYLNLFIEAALQPGETVLIHAGASGVGTAAIQLAHDRGAKVIATVGSPEKAELARSLGAELAINHRLEDVTARLEPLEIDVALDCLGGEDLAKHLPFLRTGGRWVIIGLMAGRTVSLDLRPLLSKRLRIIGSTLRARPVEEKARIMAGLLREVWPRIEAGAVRPVIHTVMPISQVAAAHALVERNENLGKVVLSVP